MPRGGRRPGAGRKPKSDRERLLDGNAGKRGRVLAYPGVDTAPPEIEEFEAPDTLTREERQVWLRQAPHAFAMRTLTRATAMAFERYCQMVVLEAKLATSPLTRAGADHRGLIQRVNTFELQYRLTPCGKAMEGAAAPASAPANPLERFVRARG